ncbi:hypothetical protein KR059_000155, partial [Drosophila kikkawai]
KSLRRLIGNILSQKLTAFQVNSLVEFSNLKCETVDRDFADFEYCHLKSVNRTYKYMTIKVRLLKVPITKVKVFLTTLKAFLNTFLLAFQINLALYQRLNGFKPFLYNTTVDGCKFLKNPRSNPVASYFYDFIKNNSNLNHPCPYDHDLELDKISTQNIDHRMTSMLPFPEGSYLFKTDWFAYGIKRAVVNVYLTLS